MNIISNGLVGYLLGENCNLQSTRQYELHNASRRLPRSGASIIWFITSLLPLHVILKLTTIIIMQLNRSLDARAQKWGNTTKTIHLTEWDLILEDRLHNGDKAIPVTGRRGLQGCLMLEIPHCLGNRLTDGGEVVSPTHRPHFTS
jgi:hypothetical protein